MSETKVFRKVQEISRQDLSGKPPVFVSRLEEELGMNNDTVLHHLDSLKKHQLIKFNDISAMTISLTDIGKHAII